MAKKRTAKAARPKADQSTVRPLIPEVGGIRAHVQLDREFLYASQQRDGWPGLRPTADPWRLAARMGPLSLEHTWRAMECTPKATAPPPLGDVMSYRKALDACNVAMGWCEANAAKTMTAEDELILGDVG